MACSPIALPLETGCPPTHDFNLDFAGEVLRVLPLTGGGFDIFLSGGASIYVPEIVPTWLTFGDSNTVENCTTSCDPCNSRKNDKLINGVQICIFYNLKTYGGCPENG